MSEKDDDVYDKYTKHFHSWGVTDQKNRKFDPQACRIESPVMVSLKDRSTLDDAHKALVRLHEDTHKVQSIEGDFELVITELHKTIHAALFAGQKLEGAPSVKHEEFYDQKVEVLLTLSELQDLIMACRLGCLDPEYYGYGERVALSFWTDEDAAACKRLAKELEEHEDKFPADAQNIWEFLV